MNRIVEAEQALESAETPLIDVRAPSEYARGHIPGAATIPLFDDSQRAEVGTAYRQVGRRQAILRGMEIAGNRTEEILDQVRTNIADREPVLYCWRGGMRSEGFAWLLAQSGIRSTRIAGGYKAFRRTVQSRFAEPARLIILAGRTGCGKTRMLQQLRHLGQQVIDLEGLANHRGSAFGAIGQDPQPSGEQFENELFMQWRTFDRSQPIWVEGESKAIGKIRIPDSFWNQMLAAPIVLVDVDRDSRIEHLVELYGDASSDELIAAIQQIRKRLGGLRTQQAVEAAQQRRLHEVASITLDYYDQAYGRALQSRPAVPLQEMQMSQAGQIDDPERLIAVAERMLD